jgi:hypothetical protein
LAARPDLPAALQTSQQSDTNHKLALYRPNLGKPDIIEVTRLKQL